MAVAYRICSHFRRIAPGLAAGLALLLGFPGAGAAAQMKIGGSGAALGTMQLLIDAYTGRYPDFAGTTIPSLGSAGSIKALAAGAIDIAVTSRPMNEAERELPITETEYARTPFVFAVAVRSKVSAITVRELADIYAGRTTQWPDGSPIRIVLRPANDIDTAMIKGISPQMEQAVSAAERRPGVAFSATDDDAADDIEKIPGAIGPTSIALILSEKRALRALRLDGVDPSPANIAAGSYPHYKRLFIVTAAKPSPAVERFIAFVQSAPGRRMLLDTGHWIP